MGQITSLFPRKVVAAANVGPDRGRFLSALGIEADAPTDPKLMVEAESYYAVFEELARADDEGITLPLRTGASMRTDDYGAFGLAWKAAPTLADSFKRADRYARVLTTVATYNSEPAGGDIYRHLRRDGDRRKLGFCLSNEATLASIATICGEVSTVGFQPRAVFFKHRGPGTTEHHEKHFGCPVHFGADRDALLIPNAIVEAPNKVGDAGIAAFFDSHLERELSALVEEVTLEKRVQEQVVESLSDGVPSLSSVASALAMSARTLQRRLSEGEHSFQSLVDDARRDLAKTLLRETDYSLAEVAFLTGFSEQSAFNRAFKRWSGETPRSYRLSA